MGHGREFEGAGRKKLGERIFLYAKPNTRGSNALPVTMSQGTVTYAGRLFIT